MAFRSSVIDAAQQSPVYKMAMDWKLALPLHPEYRTLPMVWYVPPLSPIQSAADAGELPHTGDPARRRKPAYSGGIPGESADGGRHRAGTAGAETHDGDAPLQTR